MKQVFDLLQKIKEFYEIDLDYFNREIEGEKFCISWNMYDK